jgi:cytochrome c-type biogenesis protein
MISGDLTLLIAFSAGLVSFFSPCFFPVLPGFFALMGAQGAGRSAADRARNLIVGVAFILGFAAVFFLIGTALLASLSFIDPFSFRKTLAYVSGAILILVGLVMIGVIPSRTFRGFSFLTTTSSKSIGAFLFGAGFAATWSPCVGAVLGGVFALSLSQPELGYPLFLAYIVGFGIPLILLGVFAAELNDLVEKVTRGTTQLQGIFGALLCVVGMFLIVFPPEQILKCF